MPGEQGNLDKQKPNSRNLNEPEGKKDNGKESTDPNIDVDEEEDEEDAEAMVEEEESEFSHFEDDEEFENYRPVRICIQLILILYPTILECAPIFIDIKLSHDTQYISNKCIYEGRRRG